VSLPIAGSRSQPARILDWMMAWDGAVRGLLAERPGATPHVAPAFSPASLAVAATMVVALGAAVAKVGPHPFLLVMFVAFGALYVALVPLPLLLRPLGFGIRKTDQADLAEAAGLALHAWLETASRSVAAWHLAREATLRKLDPLVLADSEARAAAELIRMLVPPTAPLPGVPVGALQDPASTPLSPLPSLEGWSGVSGGIVYLARRKPFTLGEVLVVVAGVTMVPPAVFLAIDGAASVVTCAVLPPDACAEPQAGRKLFLLGMVALTGLVLLWRLVARTRFECPACGSLVTIPRLAPHGRCQGCRRRVWVQWRRQI